MAQMKEENKAPEKEQNKMEISNITEAEYKTLVIRMLKELSEDLNSIKNSQLEMKDTLKNTRKSGTYSQDCSTQQRYHLELKGRQRASQMGKI